MSATSGLYSWPAEQLYHYCDNKRTRVKEVQLSLSLGLDPSVWAAVYYVTVLFHRFHLQPVYPVSPRDKLAPQYLTIDSLFSRQVLSVTLASLCSHGRNSGPWIMFCKGPGTVLLTSSIHSQSENIEIKASGPTRISPLV